MSEPTKSTSGTNYHVGCSATATAPGCDCGCDERGEECKGAKPIAELRERLAAHYYNVPWPPEANYTRYDTAAKKAAGIAARQKHRDDEEVKNAEFERDLAAACGVSDHPKRAKLWSLAWEEGHACGLSDVLAYYTDFVELIK